MPERERTFLGLKFPFSLRDSGDPFENFFLLEILSNSAKISGDKTFYRSSPATSLGRLRRSVYESSEFVFGYSYQLEFGRVKSK